MRKTADETEIVRPFGLIGEPYEVKDTGLRYYRLAWITVIIGVLMMTLAHVVGLPLAVVFAFPAIAFVLAVRLCILVVRNGKKL